MNIVRHASLSLLLLATACGESARTQPAPQPAPSGGESTPQPAPQPTPEPQPQPAPAHTEAVLSGGHITLNHQIQFETNRDAIQEAASASVLSDLVALLRENSQIRRLRVEGHADVRGNDQVNQQLSERRAAAVAAYLRTHGFESITIESVGYGHSRPLCSEDTDACHERNRRVEFTITDPAPSGAAQ